MIFPPIIAIYQHLWYHYTPVNLSSSVSSLRSFPFLFTWLNFDVSLSAFVISLSYANTISFLILHQTFTSLIVFLIYILIKIFLSGFIYASVIFLSSRSTLASSFFYLPMIYPISSCVCYGQSLFYSEHKYCIFLYIQSSDTFLIICAVIRLWNFIMHDVHVVSCLKPKYSYQQFGKFVFDDLI